MLLAVMVRAQLRMVIAQFYIVNLSVSVLAELKHLLLVLKVRQQETP